MPSDEDDMRSAGAVITRLCQALGAKNDPDLAKKLGKGSRTTVSAWRNRNSVPYAECIQVSTEYGLSLDWLLLGIGEMQRQAPIAHNAPIDDELLSDIIDTLENMCVSENVTLSVRKRAEAISLLYEYFQRDKKVERPVVARILKLVA